MGMPSGSSRLPSWGLVAWKVRFVIVGGGFPGYFGGVAGGRRRVVRIRDDVDVVDCCCCYRLRRFFGLRDDGVGSRIGVLLLVLLLLLRAPASRAR